MASFNIDSGKLMKHITMNVTIKPPFGWLSWRLYVAKALIWMAAKVMRCGVVFGEPDAVMETTIVTHQPERMQVTCGQVEISSDGIRGSVSIDGVPVSRVKEYTLTHKVDDLPKLDMTIQCLKRESK